MRYPFSPGLHSVAKRLNINFNNNGEFCYNNPGNFESFDRIAKFCKLFGHNLCHLLTLTLYNHAKGNAEIIEFVGVDSKDVYHSCVLIDKRYTFNAYGMMTLGDARHYFKSISTVMYPPNGENVIHKPLSIDKLNDIALNPKKLTPSEILTQFQTVLDFTTLTLDDFILHKTKQNV